MSTQLIKESKNETNNSNPKIRIEMEPVEIWLNEEEGSLALGALQAAFPGCSGLYYRENTTNCDEKTDYGNVAGEGDVHAKCRIGPKCAVKFDGRKFFPPKGQTQFFISLGAAAPKFAAQNYENATKQFQRSLALVQSVMKRNIAENYADSPPHTDDTNFSALRENKLSRLTKKNSTSDDSGAEFSPQKKSTSSESVGNDKTLKRLRELETQFAELSQISAGKDEIISLYRRKNEEIQAELGTDQLRLKEALERLKEEEGKCAVQEDELEMYRTMSKEQDSMCNEINDLVKKLADLKRQSELKIAILESSVEQRNSKIQELVKRNESLSATICELREKCAERKLQCEKLQRQKSEICANFNAKSAQFLEKSANDENCRDELLADNLKMHEKNAELMREIGKLQKSDEYFKSLQNILASKVTDKELLEKLRNCFPLNRSDAEFVDSTTVEPQKKKLLEMNLKDQLFSYSFN